MDGSTVRIGGRFEPLALVGEGGMGEVWKALDVTSNEVVALKRMRAPERSPERFLREASLLSRVTHAALVRYVADGVDDGMPWLAMEWIEGETLAERAARSPLSLGETLALARRVAGALAALHAAGIVHRDVKPSNVMLPGGNPAEAKLLDLGVARTDAGPHPLTATNLVVGTVGYMAPEQARSSRDVDARADVFALGCVLFECLTGEPVYTGDNAIALLAKLLAETPRRLRSVRPDLPEPLDALLASMLARDRAARPSVAAVLNAIDQLDTSQVALVESAPAVRVSRAEQRLAVAVVIELEPTTPFGATVATGDARGDEERVRAIARSAGGDAIALGPTSSLVFVEARGTVADRAAMAAEVGRAVLVGVAGVRGALAAGLATTSERVPAGQVLERAASLARTAPQGVLLVDDVAAELLGERFHIEGRALGPRRSAPGARKLLGKSVPFVGREKELALLEATLAESADERAPRAVLIVAPPGMGKSRLGRELAMRIRERGEATLLEGAAEVASAGSVHVLLRALVRHAAKLGVRAGRDDHERLRAHVRGLPDVEDPDRLADFLGEIAGAPNPGAPCFELSAARGEPELLARWTRRSVREWLRAESTRAPLVLLVEDLHWADDATIAHLGDALRTLRDRALAVVALARPEIRARSLDRWPELVEIELHGLGARPAERIVRAVLGDALDTSTVKRLVERSGGNPLFLEELVRFYGEGRKGELPATVLAIVHARIEGLEPELRHVLRSASVLGEHVTCEGVAAIAGVDAHAVRAACEQLVKAELLEPGIDDDRWSFRHALVRDAVYATLPDADAKAAHLRAAEHYEQSGSADAVAIAEHFERAGQAKRAIPFLARAAERHLEAGAHDESFALVDRAASLGPEEREQAELALLSMYRAIAAEDYATVVEKARIVIARFDSSDPRWYVALGGLAHGAGFTGDLEAGAEAARAWLAAPDIPLGRLSYSAALSVVFVLSVAGVPDLVRAAIGRLREPPAGDPVTRSWYELGHAGFALYGIGKAGAACAHGQRAFALAERTGDSFAEGLGRSMWSLGVVAYLGSDAVCDELDEMIRRYEAATPHRIVTQWLDLALAAARAMRRFSDAADALRAHFASHDRLRADMARVFVCVAAIRAGRLEDASRELDAWSPTIAAAQSAREVHAARLALLSGDPEAALARCAAAEPMLARGASPWTWEWLGGVRVEALYAVGRREEATRALGDALARLEETLEGMPERDLARALAEHEPVLALRALAERLDMRDRWSELVRRSTPSD